MATRRKTTRRPAAKPKAKRLTGIALRQKADQAMKKRPVRRTKPTKKGGKNWIKGAIRQPGALRESLGVPEGETIPAGKLAQAAKKGGKVGKRARLAQTLAKLRRKKKK